MYIYIYISPILGSQHLLPFQLRDCFLSPYFIESPSNHSRWAINWWFHRAPQNFPGPSLGNENIFFGGIKPRFFHQWSRLQKPGDTTGQLPVDSLMLPSQCSAFRSVSRFCPWRAFGWKNGKCAAGDRKTGHVWNMKMSYMLLNVE